MQMKQFRLAYGEKGLVLNLDDRYSITVIEPKFTPGLAEPEQAISHSLQSPINCPPLRECVSPHETIGIIFSDITRPMPYHLILPAILSELSHISKNHITFFNACGTHRKNTNAELRHILGDQVVDTYRIVQNDAFDSTLLTCTGKTPLGTNVYINKELSFCDLKILTGFIEPHFFAGFSGGGKAIMPGMSGIETIMNNHSSQNIQNSNASWGITKGNPVWEEILSVAQSVGRTFLINVTLNNNKEITGIFSGDLSTAHAQGCEFVRSLSMAPISHLFDIVVTSNSGYPLDLNLYQSVKGMSVAAQVVRSGGIIIIATECRDGIPDHGLYGQLLKSSTDPRDLLAKINTPGFRLPDQWQVQIQELIQLKNQIYVYSDYLSDEQIRSAMLEPCRDIPELIEQFCKEYGSRSKICILPEGPQTIPYLVK